jgi:quercetin dioxygenase-like cupin family protein
MTIRLGFAATLLLVPISASSQISRTSPVSIEKEPHHSLAFENDRVRVLHLHLKPGEITESHRHASLYAYFSLQAVTISNEVPGHAPVITQLQPGELRTSKGGFNVAERNRSSEAANIFIVEPAKSGGEGFATPLAMPTHDAGIVEQYSGPSMRVYSLGIAATGSLGEHTGTYDSLLMALTDSDIRVAVGKNGSEDWKLKTGEIRWMPRGTIHSETNVGTTPAALIVFELN